MSHSPFSASFGPEWNLSLARGAEAFFKTSPLLVPNEEQRYFFLGELLAWLHRDGYSYADLHPDNVGTLPSGGFAILDPGGFSEVNLTPAMAASDFVVPALSMSLPQFGAFLSGYVFRASKIIDPVHPGHSTALANIILGEDLEVIPEEGEPYFRVAEALTAAAGHDSVAVITSSALIAAVFALTLASFKFEYEVPPNLHAAFGKLLRLQPASLPTEIRFGFLLENLRDTHQIPNAVVDDTKLRPVSDERGAPLVSLYGRPKAALAGGLVPLIDELDGRNGFLRGNLLVAIGALLNLAARAGSPDRGTLAAYVTLAFGGAASSFAELAELERHHRVAWSLFAYVSTIAKLSPDSVEFDSPNSCFELCLLFHRAATLDRILFEASLSGDKGQKTAAWYAGFSSIDANRKSMLLLLYTLYALPASEPVPAVILPVAHAALQLHLSNEMRVATAAIERDCSFVVGHLGGRAEVLIKGHDWAEQGLKLFAQEPLTVAQLLAFLHEGIQYFAFVDLEVKSGSTSTKHSRQDIYHGIGRTFDREEDRGASPLIEDETS